VIEAEVSEERSTRRKHKCTLQLHLSM